MRGICVIAGASRIESPEDLPLRAIGKLISAISSEKWMKMYEQSRPLYFAEKRMMTKAG